MKWKKVSQEKSILLDESLMDYPVEKKIMFGCPAYFINKNMFAGVHQSSLFIRLSEEDKKKILDSSGDAKIFEPIKGRQMKEYVVLPEEILNNEKSFKKWLSVSYKHVSTMMPKLSKSKKKETETDSIRLSATFNVEPARLYSAWLNSKEHSLMTGSTAKVSKKDGGSFRAWDGYISGRNSNLQPNKCIIQLWRTSDFSPEEKNSTLEIYFEEKNGKTILTLIHTNIPKGQGKNYKKGWVDYYFTPMEKYFNK